MKTAIAASATAEPVEGAHSKRAILGDFFALGTSRYFAFGFSFVAGIVQRRLLGPYVIGIWQMLAIVRQYLSYGDLGVARGADQRLPALVASNSPELASTRNTTFTLTLLSVATVNLVVCVATFLWPWPVDALALWGIRGMTVLAIVEAMANTMEVSVVRAPARFRLLSQQVFLSETLFAVLSIPAAMLAGLWGLLGAALASLVLKIGFMRARTQERFEWEVDWTKAAALWRIGFPLTLYAVVVKSFDSLDRLLLVQGGEVEALGYYSIAIMTTVFLAQFPAVIATVFLPRTMSWFELRERGDLVRYFEQAQLGILVVTGVASAVSFLVIPPIIRHVLPAFVAGIPAMQIGVVSAVLVGLTQLPIQFLAASNRQWALVGLMVAATGLYYGIAQLFAPQIHGATEWLQFAAWSRLVAYLVLASIMTAWARQLLTHLRWTWILEMVAIGIYLVALPIVADSIWPAPAQQTILGDLFRLSKQLAVCGAGLLPLLVFFERRTSVVSNLLAGLRVKW